MDGQCGEMVTHWYGYQSQWIENAGYRSYETWGDIHIQENDRNIIIDICLSTTLIESH